MERSTTSLPDSRGTAKEDEWRQNQREQLLTLVLPIIGINRAKCGKSGTSKEW